METEKDLLIYFQTSLMNIGMYTSLSFAALGYPRFYRNKDALYNIYLIIFSIIFIILSLTISMNLIWDINKFQKTQKSSTIKKWIYLPKTIIVFNMGSLLLAFYTFYREISTEANINDLRDKLKVLFY